MTDLWWGTDCDLVFKEIKLGELYAACESRSDRGPV